MGFIPFIMDDYLIKMKVFFDQEFEEMRLALGNNSKIFMKPWRQGYTEQRAMSAAEAVTDEVQEEAADCFLFFMNMM